MNSVFSAFKSNKPTSTSSSTITDGKTKVANKKMNGANNIDVSGSSSYENLRHIREIGSSTKMNTFVDVNDDHLMIGNKNNKRSTVITVPSPITELPMPMIDHNNFERNCFPSGTDTVDCSAVNQHVFNATNQQQQQQPKAISASESNQCDIKDAAAAAAIVVSDEVDDCCDRKSPSTETETKESCGGGVSPNICNESARSGGGLYDATSDGPLQQLPPTNNGLQHAPIILANRGGGSESNLTSSSLTASAVPSNKTNRFQKRLSLSGFANNSLPSVHGRPASAGGSSNGGAGNGGSGGEVKKTRLSTHQRNLSLDFR